MMTFPSNENQDDGLKRGSERIVCPTCSEKSLRVGAQDECDVYLCEQGHVTRVKVGASNGLATGDSKTA